MIQTKTCFSGGADGSDTVWENECMKAGIPVKSFTFAGHKGQRSPNAVTLNENQLNEAFPYLERANQKLKRWIPRSKPWIANLLCRNWYQVKDAEALYAIGQLTSSGVVDGGTGWAVQMAIDRGIPVFVYEQNRMQWIQWKNEGWVDISSPVIYNLFAGVGTRKINASGEQAIAIFIQRMINEYNDNGQGFSRSSENQTSN